MFRIGEFSKFSGLSADTLYHYDRMGLLPPARVDSFTGYRYYDAAQLVTVNKVLALKDAGLSLEEIAALLKRDPATSALVTLLEEKATAMELSLNAQQERLARLHTNLFLIKNGGIPLMNNVTIKQVEPILVASIRRSFPKAAFDKGLEEMWPQVNEAIDEAGVKRTIPCLMLYYSGFWNEPDLGVTSSPDTLDVEVAEPIVRQFPGDETVTVYSLPKVEKMACIVHNGPFSTIWEAFDALFQWMRGNGYEAAGPIREIYHKGDWATDNPDEYVTELQVPLR